MRGAGLLRGGGLHDAALGLLAATGGAWACALLWSFDRVAAKQRWLWALM